MRRILMAASVLALFSAAPAQAAREPMTLGPFAGVLPCADCPGVRTELTLRRKAAGWAEGAYVLRETRIGGRNTVIIRGDWTTLRGDATDEDAVVYELNPDKPAAARHFLKVGEDRVRALDRDLNSLPAGQPAELRRVR